MLKKLFLLLSLFVNQSLIAQDNQRYLALSLVNIDEKDDNLNVKEIEKAYQKGFNAVNIAVLWDFIKVYRAKTPNPWIQVDNQVKKAAELGMKIGLRVWVNGWCGVNYPQSQWCSNFDPNELMVDGDGRYDITISGPGTRSMTSFASTSSLKRMKDFTAEVMERYKKYQEDGTILYVNLATTGEQELGYSFGRTGTSGLFDYSIPTKEAYRVWLRRKYCNNLSSLKRAWGEANYPNLKSFSEIEPKYNFYFQYSFEGPDGRDWFIFRNFLLKRFNQQFIQAVRSVKVNRPFKIINDYGSVFDDVSVRRGTLAFQDLGEGTDGIKINNALNYNHRFSMDYIRSNMPNKWIMNETEVNNFIPNQSIEAINQYGNFQQTDQSFTHGAKMVSVFVSSADGNMSQFLDNGANWFSIIKNKWLNNKSPISVVQKGKMNLKLSNLIFEGGCSSKCKALTEWQDIYAKNGGIPVEIRIEEDYLKDSLVCDNPNFDAEYEGVLQKADCKGGYGWIVNKSNLPQAVKYEVQLDGKVIKSALADSLNPDSQRYFGSANHGFAFKLPNLSDGEHSLKIKIPESSYLISYAKLNLVCKNGAKDTQYQADRLCSDCLELNLYPNPANDRVSLGFNLDDFRPVLIEIFDVQGRRVYLSDTYGVAGDNDLEINTQSWASGNYLVNVKIYQKYYQRKFIKR